MSASSVRGDNEIEQALKFISSRMRDVIRNSSNRIADEVGNYVKYNHPWRNRTGETERTTIGQVVSLDDRASRVAITVGTYYSKYLELSFGGKYTWVVPGVMRNRSLCYSIVADEFSKVLRDSASSITVSKSDV